MKLTKILLMKKFIYFWLLVLICTGVLSCSCKREDDIAGSSTVRVGITPGERKEILQDKYKRLLEYLSEETGLRYELLIPETYQELSDMFHDAKIDLVHFGGYTFVKAYNNDHAFPLVMRDVDIQFTSYFITKFEHHGKSISDFKDKVFSFGSMLSTSGHLMPRFFVNEKNIMPETFFSRTLYSGAHDKTASWVHNGTADLGVANAKTIDSLFENGYLDKDDIYIVWETPPYADYVWAVQPSMGKSTRIKIRDAFLNLSLENENHKLILDDLEACYFFPAGINDFTEIESVINKLDNP